jgi:hypothetical protein
MADKIMSIMMQIPNQIQLEKADVAITPVLDDRPAADFSGVDSLILAGERAADSAIAMIRQKIEAVRISSIDDDLPLSNVSIHFSGDLDTLADVQQTLLQRIYADKISRYSVRRNLHRLYTSGNYSEVRADIRTDDSVNSITFHAILNTRLAGVVFFNNSMIPSDTLHTPFTSLEGKVINSIGIGDMLLPGSIQFRLIPPAISPQSGSMRGGLSIGKSKGTLRLNFS